MADIHTFLTPLYVMIDDFSKTSLPVELHQEPHAALSRSAATCALPFPACPCVHNLTSSATISRCCSVCPPSDAKRRGLG